jgi:hypothetical protein
LVRDQEAAGSNPAAPTTIITEFVGTPYTLITVLNSILTHFIKKPGEAIHLPWFFIIKVTFCEEGYGAVFYEISYYTAPFSFTA